MKVLIGILLLFSSGVLSNNHFKRSMFEQFIKEHNKSYSSLKEYLHRLSIFSFNLSRAASFENFSPFMDLTSTEFRNKMGLKERGKPYLQNPLSKQSILLSSDFLTHLPSKIDYRELGAVSPVKSQGSCGSCWAFTTAGVLESQYFLKNNAHIDLSEQQLVDCVRIGNTIGCGDGYMLDAYEYLKNTGIMHEIDYPYEDKDDICKYNPNKPHLNLKTFYTIEANEVKIAEALVKYGPLAIAINASSLHFLGKGQILNPDTDDDCNPKDINHAVILVGYTETYWIIKNSWGPNWNDEGFFKLIRNKNACGLTFDVSVPIISTK